MATTIKMAEGTTYRAEFTLYDETSSPIDLTGATLQFSAYLPSAAKVGVPTVFLTKTVGNGLSVTNAVGGVVLVTFNPTDTTDKAGVYEWELELNEINGDVWLAGSGVLLVQPGRRLDTT